MSPAESARTPGVVIFAYTSAIDSARTPGEMSIASMSTAPAVEMILESISNHLLVKSVLHAHSRPSARQRRPGKEMIYSSTGSRRNCWRSLIRRAYERSTSGTLRLCPGGRNRQPFQSWPRVWPITALGVAHGGEPGGSPRREAATADDP